MTDGAREPNAVTQLRAAIPERITIGQLSDVLAHIDSLAARVAECEADAKYHREACAYLSESFGVLQAYVQAKGLGHGGDNLAQLMCDEHAALTVRAEAAEAAIVRVQALLPNKDSVRAGDMFGSLRCADVRRAVEGDSNA